MPEEPNRSIDLSYDPAAGLILAGVVSDKSCKHGAVITLGALIMPFLMPALRTAVWPAVISGYIEK